MLAVSFIGLKVDLELVVKLLSQHKVEGEVIISPESQYRISTNQSSYGLIKAMIDIALFLS